MNKDTGRGYLLKLVESSSIKIRLSKNGMTLATVSVILADTLEIHGWRVCESKKSDDLWIQPPSYKTKNGKYRPMIWIDDEEIRKIIECKIIEAYEKEDAGNIPF